MIINTGQSISAINTGLTPLKSLSKAPESVPAADVSKTPFEVSPTPAEAPERIEFTSRASTTGANPAAEPLRSSPFDNRTVLPEEVMQNVSIRLAKANAIRAEIAAGTYETPERLAGTVERLLDVIV